MAEETKNQTEELQDKQLDEVSGGSCGGGSGSGTGRVGALKLS